MTKILSEENKAIITEVVMNALEDAGYSPENNIPALVDVIYEQALLLPSVDKNQILDEVVAMLDDDSE